LHVVTASADSSGNCEKWWMELSQSYSSSGLDCSEDTFEPFIGEEEPRENKPSASSCSAEDLEWSAVSDTLESMSWSAGQHHADEQSEVANSAAVERDVMGKWIDLAGMKQDKSVIKTHAVIDTCFVDLCLTEIPELSDGELDAFRSFCTVKISQMRRQLISKQANGGKARQLQCGFTAKKLETSDLSCIVPDRLMNRICLKNIRETVKQVVEAQIHESSVCPDCQKKKAELAEITFLRRKKILMESALLQEKFEEQLYSRDVLTLLGEALRSFPKPSEDPRSLWQRLKGQKIDSLKVVNTTQGHKELGESSAGSCTECQ
ncbi:LOW QUALITY PROTEIN: uncharacterized protein C8orf48 homolog, partial [Antrostomus carolinensis]|uniref:LOW QUALITY PROTEIN: uncharacterized protein C8orf48 homolog n=1 Tax=Antrostomus carolinensis TaxID=279965 RepID=UPI0010A9915F